jgi:hypothetical protein
MSHPLLFSVDKESPEPCSLILHELIPCNQNSIQTHSLQVLPEFGANEIGLVQLGVEPLNCTRGNPDCLFELGENELVIGCMGLRKGYMHLMESCLEHERVVTLLVSPFCRSLIKQTFSQFFHLIFEAAFGASDMLSRLR